MTEEYKTIASYVEAMIRIKGSRFIGQLFPAASETEADTYLGECRRKYHDATHRCYAFRNGIDGSVSRFSDDGEPSGTAGKPILSVLEHNGVTNVLLIVIRYFGGIKLGTGGLVRAYTETAQAVLAEATVITKTVLHELRITFPYEYTSGVMHVISVNDLKIRDTEYSEDVTLFLSVPPSRMEAIRTHLREVTSGNIALKQ
jgi:uncharacterized YigZ family protein